MRISDWSSDVGSADLEQSRGRQSGFHKSRGVGKGTPGWSEGRGRDDFGSGAQVKPALVQLGKGRLKHAAGRPMKMMRSVGAERHGVACLGHRSEEHTSELQSLMRISYAVFCLKKKN